METNVLRFVLAAGAVTLYALAVVLIWGKLIDAPAMPDVSFSKWALGTLLFFFFVCLLGGIVSAGVAHISQRQNREEGRKFALRMAFVMIIVWASQPFGHDFVFGNLGFQTAVDTVLRAASVVVSLAIFYFIAFKPVEAEAAQ